MCLYKRVIWACGCPRGVVLASPCDKRGTPGCRRRHLLDRVRVERQCRNHGPLTPSPQRRRYGETGCNRRGSVLIIRRRSLSGSSGSSGASGASGSPNAASTTINTTTNNNGANSRGSANGSPTANRGADETRNRGPETDANPGNTQ